MLPVFLVAVALADPDALALRREATLPDPLVELTLHHLAERLETSHPGQDRERQYRASALLTPEQSALALYEGSRTREGRENLRMALSLLQTSELRERHDLTRLLLLGRRAPENLDVEGVVDVLLDPARSVNDHQKALGRGVDGDSLHLDVYPDEHAGVVVELLVAHHQPPSEAARALDPLAWPLCFSGFTAMVPALPSAEGGYRRADQPPPGVPTMPAMPKPFPEQTLFEVFSLPGGGMASEVFLDVSFATEPRPVVPYELTKNSDRWFNFGWHDLKDTEVIDEGRLVACAPGTPCERWSCPASVEGSCVFVRKHLYVSYDVDDDGHGWREWVLQQMNRTILQVSMKSYPKAVRKGLDRCAP